MVPFVEIEFDTGVVKGVDQGEGQEKFDLELVDNLQHEILRRIIDILNHKLVNPVIENILRQCE